MRTLQAVKRLLRAPGVERAVGNILPGFERLQGSSTCWGRFPSAEVHACVVPRWQGPFSGIRRDGFRVPQQVCRCTFATSASDRLRLAAKKVSSTAYSRLPKPVGGLWNYAKSFPNRQRDLVLQADALWKNHHKKVIVAALLTTAYILWWTVSEAVTILSSSGAAQLGGMAVAASLLSASYMLFRWRYAVDPKAVYRLALLQLNTHPGILDVMGAPLAGGEMIGCLVSGGGLRTKGWGLRFQPRRVHMVFPLKGAERRGLAFLEAKRRKGVYEMKVLGVDVPSYGAQEERVYVIGDATTCSQASVLDALRGSVVKSYQLKKVHEEDDDNDEIADRYERQKRKLEKRTEKAHQASKQMDEGWDLHPYELTRWGAMRVVKQIRLLLHPRK